ncbi:hypothetical protein RU07_02345 [Agrobacterium tumefaciens]|uniref:Large ribosomal subunit protein bL12 C-terminal domain-containing protein n=1 Tax=Agrobacterium tumefaciens TaxID=358 RepID=A0A0D0K8Q7_AGRTU|nr:hypothetical protein RU07_02345 [Agrobacterium tumefaciens]
MGEFKKGDFVRRTSGSSLYTSAGRHEAGFVGQVSDVKFRGGTNDIIFTNGHEGIAQNYEPWQPRVGERVNVKYGHGWNGEGEVVRFFGVSAVVLMKTGECAGIEGGFNVSSLEPILSTATIVALIENGKPKPSSTPHVHASTGAAEKEAKRLAAKFKGKQFGVFTLTTTHEEAAPVYDHKWQNLAVLGLKIDAIKELRSITGMGLKPAKDAVEYFVDAA